MKRNSPMAVYARLSKELEKKTMLEHKKMINEICLKREKLAKKHMNKDAKNISSSHRPQIDTLKNRIRFSIRPFDGTGRPFIQALSELRKEGLKIIYNRQKCHYIIVNET